MPDLKGSPEEKDKRKATSLVAVTDENSKGWQDHSARARKTHAALALMWLGSASLRRNC
jgi:hypothetical protein